MTDDQGPGIESVVVLDYLPHGRADDDRPQYQKQPLAQVLAVDTLALHEIVIERGTAVTIGDTVTVDPLPEGFEQIRPIGYGELSRSAQSELEHAIRELISTDETRFISFFNEAGPITLRLHQLTLLPGIGDKLRDNILDARNRAPFDSLDDVEDRVAGLHQVRETLVERILEELRGDNVKYRLFVRSE